MLIWARVTHVNPTNRTFKARAVDGESFSGQTGYFPVATVKIGDIVEFAAVEPIRAPRVGNGVVEKLLRIMKFPVIIARAPEDSVPKRKQVPDTRTRDGGSGRNRTTDWSKHMIVKLKNGAEREVTNVTGERLIAQGVAEEVKPTQKTPETTEQQ